jgi:hypothetical protein
MRDLEFNELQFVSGANRSPAPPSTGSCCSPCPPTMTRTKGNNGFGNSGNDPAPGNSGTNNSPSASQKRADVVR